jgi:hypothetical protein
MLQSAGKSHGYRRSDCSQRTHRNARSPSPGGFGAGDHKRAILGNRRRPRSRSTPHESHDDHRRPGPPSNPGTGRQSYSCDSRWAELSPRTPLHNVRSVADALPLLQWQAARTPPPQWVRVVGGWSEFSSLSDGCRHFMRSTGSAGYTGFRAASLRPCVAERCRAAGRWIHEGYPGPVSRAD